MRGSQKVCDKRLKSRTKSQKVAEFCELENKTLAICKCRLYIASLNSNPDSSISIVCYLLR